jgi:hypothetical protein
MAKFTILVLAAINGAVLWVLALMGAGESAHFMVTVLVVGFAWIVGCTVWAWVKSSRPEGGGVTVAAITLPLGYLLTLVGMEFAGFLGGLKADRPEFVAACQGEGVRYIAAPATPVKSVAYDWPEGQLPPQTNSFEIGARGNVSDLRWQTPDMRLPASIEYFESRCCPHGGPLGEPQPYLRHERRGSIEYIPTLTADALVSYETRETRLAEAEYPMVKTHLKVIDRRDGRLLAELRYALDRHRHRGCGETSKGKMDETDFVSRAVGAR